MWCVRCVKRIMYSLPLANVLALSQGSSTQSFKVVLCINQTFTFFVKGAHQLLLRPPLATSPPLPLPPSLFLSLSFSPSCVCVCVCVCVCARAALAPSLQVWGTVRRCSTTFKFAQKVRLVCKPCVPPTLTFGIDIRAKSGTTHQTSDLVLSPVRQRSLALQANRPDASPDTALCSSLSPKSPAGELLYTTEEIHPADFYKTVDNELTSLCKCQEEEDERDWLQLNETEAVLYRRITEFKRKDRQQALEDVLYFGVIHQFRLLPFQVAFFFF